MRAQPFEVDRTARNASARHIAIKHGQASVPIGSERALYIDPLPSP